GIGPPGGAVEPANLPVRVLVVVQRFCGSGASFVEERILHGSCHGARGAEVHAHALADLWGAVAGQYLVGLAGSAFFLENLLAFGDEVGGDRAVSVFRRNGRGLLRGLLPDALRAAPAAEVRD